MSKALLCLSQHWDSQQSIYLIALYLLNATVLTTMTFAWGMSWTSAFIVLVIAHANYRRHYLQSKEISDEFF